MNPQIGFLLNKSFEYLQNSNWDTAELYLKQALKSQPNNPHTLGLLAVVNAKREQYHAALEYANKSLKILPNNPLTLSNLGNIYLGLREFEKAAEAYDKSIKLDQDYVESWLNRGNALQELNRYEEALTHYDRALNLDPNSADTWSNKGNALQELKRFEEALIHYDKALNLKPNYTEAWSHKGNALQELKRFEEAITQYNQSISLNPSYAKVYVQKGNALSKLKRFEEALTCYDQALNINPVYAEAHASKATALHELKCFEEALGCYDQALNINPVYAEAYACKGNTLYELRQYDEAMIHHDKALSLKPNYAEGWSNKGNTLNELKRYEEAIAYYDEALSLRPDYAEGWSNKGNTLNELKRYDEAITHYSKALSLTPDIDWIYGELLKTSIKICSWPDLADSIAILSAKVMAGEKATLPFPLLALNDDALLHKRSSEIYVQSIYPFNNSLGAISRRSGSKKIRIGYFSADFKNHPVALLLAQLFEIHDRDRFEIYAFSLVQASDAMRGRLVRAFDHFVNVETQSDMQIAELSRDLSIDIAIDLTGHTKDSRTGIFSYRAAPIQVNWLGYPGTMGADYIDYIIADKTIIPESHRVFYTEKIAYLPHTYMVDDSKRVASLRAFTKEECGLPENKFIFCCFNNDYKFNPQMLDCWSRILKSTEDSILWISENNELFKANIKIEFQNREIDLKRIIFAKRLESMTDHLARYALADVFLDTHPYNAHTTAVDSLKAGIPVITLIGESFASRVAASLLNAIRLPELITTNQEDYEALAIELAKNPQKLAEIKKRLAENRLTVPLFDTPRFTQNLEAAYAVMMERYQAGAKPDHINIV